jgi:alpha-tubulin suppressor-like RCC1 family protein
MCGANTFGQLMQGDEELRYEPSRVEYLSALGMRVRQIALGSSHTLVLTGSCCCRCGGGWLLSFSRYVRSRM